MLASPATAPLLTRERVSPLYFFSYTFIPLSSIAFPHIGIFCLTAQRLAHFRRRSCSIRSACSPSGCRRSFSASSPTRRRDVPAIEAKLEARATLAARGADADARRARPAARRRPRGDDVILRLVEGYAPLWLASLLGAAVMAAVMASDSQILALSTMFTEDVFAFYGGTRALRRRPCRCRRPPLRRAADGRGLRDRAARAAVDLRRRDAVRVRRLRGAVAAAGGGALLEEAARKWGALAARVWTAAAVLAVAVAADRRAGAAAGRGGADPVASAASTSSRAPRPARWCSACCRSCR